MKWFLAFVVALNLLVGAFGILRQPVPIDVHSQEVNPGQLKILPADWQPPMDASDASAARMVMASAPLSSTEASAPVAKHLPTATDASKKATPPVAAAKPAPVPPDVSKKVVAPVNGTKVASAQSCAQWPGLNDALLARVQGGLVALKLASAQMSLVKTPGAVSRGSSRLWVYYPEQANGAVAEALSTELKAKGFDNYMVQNEGEFKGTLSLGLFGKEDVAKALVARLKAAGYDKAKIVERGAKTQTTTLNFKALTVAQTDALAALQKRLTPGLALKHTTCAK